jgi:hypothetical protein
MIEPLAFEYGDKLLSQLDGGQLTLPGIALHQ